MKDSPASSKEQTIPLVVDLDGTLITTDMLYESLLVFLYQTPLKLFSVISHLFKGKASVKRYLAEHFSFQPSLLPVNQSFIDWLQQCRSAGRSIILCTATDGAIAEKIADFFGIFDEVIASDGKINMKGATKAELLEKRFGKKGYDYCGNDAADFPVWDSARKVIVVNAAEKILAEAKKRFVVDESFPVKAVGYKVWLKVVRSHQWIKNILLFVPIVAAHKLFDITLLLPVLFAFLSFCCCASAFYIVNDLLDLENDRLHPVKCRRPFASGTIPLLTGLYIAPVLLIVSVLLALSVGYYYFVALCCYMLVTTFYSMKLKQLPLFDCLCLAFLYDIRMIAGAAAIELPLSYWLITFAIFLFFSLAFLKRFTEITRHSSVDHQKLPGRGYMSSDASIIQTMGLTAGYLAVLVLALYLNSDVVVELYQTPILLWPAVPAMLFWISWLWLQACRGNMDDDPVLYAIKDKTSIVTALFLAIFIISAIGIRL